MLGMDSSGARSHFRRLPLRRRSNHEGRLWASQLLSCQPVVGRDVALMETWMILVSYPQHSVVRVLSLSGRHRGLAASFGLAVTAVGGSGELVGLWAVPEKRGRGPSAPSSMGGDAKQTARRRRPARRQNRLPTTRSSP
jgi:hypothetical protein